MSVQRQFNKWQARHRVEDTVSKFRVRRPQVKRVVAKPLEPHVQKSARKRAERKAQVAAPPSYAAWAEGRRLRDIRARKVNFLGEPQR